MAFSSSSSLSRNRHAIRSISFPTRSHPSSHQVEKELANFKTWETTISSCIPDAETICSGLTSLDRLYTSVDNLFSLPLTQQALSHNRHERIIDELLDRSMKLLDICGSVRDVVSQVKEHVRDVQSAQRRRKGGFTIDDSILNKLKKDAKRSVADLKQIDHNYGAKPLINLDPYLLSVIRVLREVSQVSITVFGLLLSFFSVSLSKPKSATRWSIVSKFIQKGTERSKDKPQFAGVDVLDCNIEGIENSLECIFRRLIKTRSSFLNILSH